MLTSGSLCLADKPWQWPNARSSNGVTGESVSKPPSWLWGRFPSAVSQQSLDTTNEHEAKDVTESCADKGQWWSPTQDLPQGLKALTEAPGMGGIYTVSFWATVAPDKRIQGSQALGQAQVQGQTQQGQWGSEEKTDGQTDMRKSWDQVVWVVCWKKPHHLGSSALLS